MKTQPLTPNQKKFLRGLAHGLNPVIIIGAQGVTESLMTELDKSLTHHELLKVKMAAGEREDRKKIIDYVVEQTKSQLVQSVGKMFVIYRPHPKEPELILPKN
jgi:RNA-binding protein